MISDFLDFKPRKIRIDLEIAGIQSEMSRLINAGKNNPQWKQWHCALTVELKNKTMS